MTFVATFTACSDDKEVADMPNVGNCYVNFAISVSNGEGGMRAPTPAGEEDGDGREAGVERENTVSGVTVILYRDEAGINTSSDPTLEFVRYFTVAERATGSSPYEITYTTGLQSIGRHHLDLSATYHAIVIANAPEVANSLIEGTSTLNAIRNVTLSKVCQGDPTMSAAACNRFIMSSEKDNTINFGSVTVTNLDGSAYTPGNDMYYDLTAQPVVIERMAARIDFWSKNSNGYMTSTENAAYTIPGYEYDVTGSSDKFVVTGIVPFNLPNGHATYGIEYLLKRLRTDIADATTSYLADEGPTTYVIDPNTDGKGESSTPALTSSLGNVYDLITASTLENTTYNPYYHSIASMHGVASASSTIDGKENVAVCYPMENCLLPTSKLYYHATGVAVIGYYYVNGTGEGTRYVYLGYLSHQGDAETYDINPSTIPFGTTDAMGGATAMKYGIVRNNIYRVCINHIDEKRNMEINIKVKKWDVFTHSTIYM
jgi:hypothetical protein